MPGTLIGGAKAAATNKRLYGKDYYARIGKIGGAKGRTGGFYGNRELARIAGAKGGTISRRGKAKPKTETAPKEMLFVDDSILIDEEFGDGFFQPTWKQKMLSKLRSR